MQKYSVLMSLYIKEQPDNLRLSIDSMLNQSLLPDEIVIVKDGPLTVELEEVLKEYTDKYSGIFKTITSEVNIGLGLALNLGLKNCRNELVARMDTDDISLPERCEKQVCTFEADPTLDIVGTMIDDFIDDPNVVTSSRIVPTEYEAICRFAKRRSAFNHVSVMYKKSAVLSCNGYSDLRRNQDVDLFGRMLHAGCKAKNIEGHLVLVRSNATLMKRRKSWQNTKTLIGVMRNLWKIGFTDFGDYLIVSIAQIGIYLVPTRVQEWVYKTFLRQSN